MTHETTLEEFFLRFRPNVIGNSQTFESPFGKKEILYADWTASGRAYRPIEERLQNEVMPFLGNTHSRGNITGSLMSEAYETAKLIVKNYVNANNNDVLIFCGTGMTGAVNKLQRILGLRIPERLTDYLKSGPFTLDETLKPVVFVTHMEHHSNHITWLETIADVEIIQAGESGNVDLHHFQTLLEKYNYRANKIAAITACSNVTGIETPYYAIAKMVHAHGGLCFVDFACSGPYVDINMHPEDKELQLDAIYFSPHKFLGGPGAAGVLVFNKKLYRNAVPDHPGGGTVVYTNPWKGHNYITAIELREDGGTPPILQGIRAAMCMRLKHEMGVTNMQNRDKEMLKIIFERFSKMENVTVLQNNIKNRLGVVSFIITRAHYNLVVKILNDRFGIQVRGGCSCAGTYGHLLLQVDKARSLQILNAIQSGDLSSKPGWVRLSIHPVMTNKEIEFMMDAIELTSVHWEEWAKDYLYDNGSNEYIYRNFVNPEQRRLKNWFMATLNEYADIHE